jgi:hypothetical protein
VTLFVCKWGNHHTTVLRINVWPVGDCLFGAPSKSAPRARAPLAPPQGRPWLLPIIIKIFNHESRPFCSISPSLEQCPNYIMHIWSTTHHTGSQLCLTYLAHGGITEQAPKTHTIQHTIPSTIHAVTITVSPVIITYLPPQYAMSDTKPLYKYFIQTFYVL